MPVRLLLTFNRIYPNISDTVLKYMTLEDKFLIISAARLHAVGMRILTKKINIFMWKNLENTRNRLEQKQC
jgi:hypothetical protein